MGRRVEVKEGRGSNEEEKEEEDGEGSGGRSGGRGKNRGELFAIQPRSKCQSGSAVPIKPLNFYHCF